MGRRSVDVTRIIKRDGFGCHYCGNPMNIYFGELTRVQASDPKRFTLEHIVPRSHGGTFGLYNLVGACSKCNGEKGNKPIKCFCDFCQNARTMFELHAIKRMVPRMVEL